jgi:mRNA interferase RelE/StbE
VTSYKVNIEKKASKALEVISEPDYSRVKEAILNLEKNPRPVGYRKLKGRKGYRIREGNYRVIYHIFDQIFIVNVIAVGDRKNVYR